MIDYPNIKTDRLVLREILFNDIPVIIEYAGNENVSKTTLNIPYPYEEKDAIFWINSAKQGFKNKTQYIFGIRLLGSDEFIGGIGLKVNTRFNRGEMGYWIAEPFWKKGFATEAIEAILKYGFGTLHLHKIYASHLVENPPSGRVMVKNKMIKEGELKDHTLKDGVYRSLCQYRLTIEEYEKL